MRRPASAYRVSNDLAPASANRGERKVPQPNRVSSSPSARPIRRLVNPRDSSWARRTGSRARELCMAQSLVGRSLSSSSARKMGMALVSPSRPRAIAAVERTVAPRSSCSTSIIGSTARRSPKRPSALMMRTVIPFEHRYLGSPRAATSASLFRLATRNSSRHFRKKLTADALFPNDVPNDFFSKVFDLRRLVPVFS